MNPFCALPEMNEVHGQLLIRVSSSICVCGGRSNPGQLFCIACRNRLDRDLRAVLCRLYALWHSGEKKAALALYDLCSDYLLDPNSLTRKRTKEEHDGR
jgi:hypothetical protein